MHMNFHFLYGIAVFMTHTIKIIDGYDLSNETHHKMLPKKTVLAIYSTEKALLISALLPKVVEDKRLTLLP